MKRTVLCLVVALTLIISLAACANKPSAAVSPSLAPETATPPSEVTVGIELATDVSINKYASVNEFIEFDEAGYQKIIITVSETVNDFKFIEIENTDKQLFNEKSVLHSLDELSPDKPFIVTWMEWGSFPHRGISFVDASGTVRSFVINQSGQDGSLNLIEF